MESIIKINKINVKKKGKSTMADIIIAFFVCCTIVMCSFFWFNKSELHIHYHRYHDQNNLTSPAASGSCGSEESGKNSVDTGDISASAHEKSEAADGVPKGF